MIYFHICVSESRKLLCPCKGPAEIAGTKEEVAATGGGASAMVAAGSAKLALLATELELPSPLGRRRLLLELDLGGDLGVMGVVATGVLAVSLMLEALDSPPPLLPSLPCGN